MKRKKLVSKISVYISVFISNGFPLEVFIITPQGFLWYHNLQPQLSEILAGNVRLQTLILHLEYSLSFKEDLNVGGISFHMQL